MKKHLGIFIILAAVVLGSTFLFLNNQIVPRQTKTVPAISTAPTVTPVVRNFSFEYPNDLPTKYIHANKWPPQINATYDKFSCKESGPGINGSPESTLRKTIDNRIYCIKSKSEGAAGSTYTEYIYSVEKDGRLITLNFTLQYPQCGNYPDQQKTVCEKERRTFDLDSLIDSMVQSVKFGNPKPTI